MKVATALFEVSSPLAKNDNLTSSFQADSQRISDGWGPSVGCWKAERNCFHSSQMFCFLKKFFFAHLTCTSQK